MLRDPSLAAADPVVVAGDPTGSGASAPVSWVHTSEVLNIADLLHGGELLLVGGVVLATAGAATRRRYVRDLAARAVAALAVETGDALPEVPTEMREEADRLGLPLLELRRVVPFVEVCRTVNGQLAHASVRRLQLLDRISHTLVEALGAGAELDELLELLAVETAADVDVTSLAGDVVAAAPGDTSRDGRPVDGEVWSAAITVTGMTIAILTLRPRERAEAAVLDAAVEKAPEAIGLALMRRRPPTALDHAERDLLTLALAGETASPRYLELADRLGLDDGAHVAVVTTFASATPRALLVETALRRRGRRVLAQVRDRRHLAVVGLPARAGARADLLAELAAVTLPEGARLVVGPLADDAPALARSLVAASGVHDLRLPAGTPAVVDAGALAVERLLVGLDRSEVVAGFVDDQLGDLLAADDGDGRLLETLTVYLRHLGRKTATADALHLQRQSLYKRLDRIEALLGPGSLTPPRLGATLVAVELETARRSIGGGR
ncbi:PucR family transcriptional regulator ligand-binding domain-containing protein [Actinomycetospora sp. Odt1-22]|uniref:PucR family transcriptional regulator ligand-binding domain-containing protein n=1 Tax=Actinomycetospora termitidis TaxID=3053470 RepID=A0ABT7M4Q4_9PSEU|nr:PucR family transcriptional regulator ligand-binding domain-containing protein [Actinomycetospora sp. Odt1-22]